MKHIIQRRKRRREMEFPRMETYLHSNLRPVKPRADFVDGLRGRLMSAPAPIPDTARRLAFAALGVMGVISGAILLVTGLRTLIIVFGGLTVLRQMRGVPPA